MGQLQVFNGVVSTSQYAFLKARLGTGTDNEACAVAGVSVNTLKKWKKNPVFHNILDLARTDRLSAFFALASSLSAGVLTALEYLLHSENGRDRSQGIRLWMMAMEMAQKGGGDEDVPRMIFNILNLKGDIPKEMLAQISPIREIPMVVPGTAVVIDV